VRRAGRPGTPDRPSVIDQLRRTSTPSRRDPLALAVGIALAAVAAPAPADTFTGPSSSATPYVVNVHPNVDIVSILTVGDSVNTQPGGTTPHRMVGFPDGMGA